MNTRGVLPEGYAPACYGTFLALVPPIVAITLALITREVYSALFAGITVGALMYSGGNPEAALNVMLYHEKAGLVPNLTDISHASVLVFVILLGTFVVLINRAGGARAFGEFAKKHIRSPRGAQLATMLMGILIFVDDGFNCMSVGSIMRPVTDAHRISRAKLAYILDSTAAPICIIAPISCWAAAVSYSVPAEYHINGFRMFIQTIPYNMYALATLTLMLLVILTRTDFGPMKKHEDNARRGDLWTTGEEYHEENEKTIVYEHGRLSDLTVPVIVLVALCILGIAYTGGLFDGAGIVNSFADADSARGLVMGSVVALIFTFWMYMNRQCVRFSDFMSAFPAGFRSMCAPMIRLVLAWNLSGVTGLLGAGEYVHRTVEASASALQMFVPAVVFAVSVFLAFSTGTSWGTFTILIPIVCAVFPADSQMFVISISACLAGAVCGDHCSPVSDTTIMSSAGARCSHINHVTTQLPYALTGAAVSAIGYLAAGIIAYHGGALPLLGTLLALLLTAAAVCVIKGRQKAAGKD
ncbi:MAG: Na+/H+ antiporter NhaC family protein [Abditibacteriota bacterium]|nr:Na+/H+ antiporter NhaC family protein [Abditibacteriota bacterium]